MSADKANGASKITLKKIGYITSNVNPTRRNHWKYEDVALLPFNKISVVFLQRSGPVKASLCCYLIFTGDLWIIIANESVIQEKQIKSVKYSKR